MVVRLEKIVFAIILNISVVQYMHFLNGFSFNFCLFATLLRKYRHCTGGHHHCMTALTWQPGGKEKVERPSTWRRTEGKERKDLGWQTWSVARTQTNHRTNWKKEREGFMCKSARRE